MQETWEKQVQSLGPEDSLEKGTETHSRGDWQAAIRGAAKSWTRLSIYNVSYPGRKACRK